MTEVTNHRVVVSERGGPNVLEVVAEPIPNPGPGEIRLRTLAAGVSAFDVMLRSITFPGFPKPPFTLGVDVVGVVDALGNGVTAPEKGETVAALLDMEGGSYTEYACIPADRAVPVPAGVDPAQAVCVVANYLTAYMMMHQIANVEAGESILVHGAAGGTGTALLELGGLADLDVYGTASKQNHDLVVSYGATPIDYRSEDFVERVTELTGDGVDVVFDQIGGFRQVWRSYQAVRKGGRLIWFGVTGTKHHGRWVIPGSLLARTVVALIPDGKKAPLTPAASPDKIERYSDTLAKLLEWLAAGSLQPHVHQRVPLLEAARAHEMIESGKYAGKVVLVA
ncbi:MAG: zinc-binding dehydrogenase [Acidimicrobiia bacterium]|nr:zinc-binding dehydrogenase [Acidimicrobiia bacterium]